MYIVMDTLSTAMSVRRSDISEYDAPCEKADWEEEDNWEDELEGSLLPPPSSEPAPPPPAPTSYSSPPPPPAPAMSTSAPPPLRESENLAAFSYSAPMKEKEEEKKKSKKAEKKSEPEQILEVKIPTRTGPLKVIKKKRGKTNIFR